jgi:hypothetical protein
MRLSNVSQPAFRSFFCAVVFVLTSTIGELMAQDIAMPRFEVAAPSTVLLTEEIVYAVKTETYRNVDALSLPIQAPLVKGVERVAIDWLNAMHGANFATYIGFFDAQSRAATESINKSLKRDEAYWIEKWKRDLKGVSVRFTRRIFYSDYTVVLYQPILSDGKVLPEEAVALRQVNGEWKVTLDLASSPILTAWNQPGLRVKRADQAFFGGRKEGIRDVLSLSEKLSK